MLKFKEINKGGKITKIGANPGANPPLQSTHPVSDNISLYYILWWNIMSP
jgi:hypothetical protein